MNSEDEIKKLLSELSDYKLSSGSALARRKLEAYRPYSKQIEFHAAGATYRERLFRAGNQLGKTVAGSAEVAFHATGRYPAWWPGYKFNKATTGWCTGVTGEVTRDTIQRLLLGPIGEKGTGFIPGDSIIETTAARGQADLMDTILIRHITGQRSRIKLKYYEQGREKFQADTLDWAWNDEEPPEDIYTEILTRTNATGGIVWTTFTPLLGMSNVVRRFMLEPSKNRIDINMTIDDAAHISAEQRKIIIDSYPAHEREARIMGTPMLGSGAIFPIADEDIACDAFAPEEIPEYWRQLGGLDFGWDHPTAAVKILHDPEADIVYIVNCYRRKEASPIMHVPALRPWGKDLMFAWPHDGLQHDKGSGKQLRKIYEDEGLNMLAEHSQFDDDRGNGVEAGVTEMLMRMETGRLKCYRHLHEFFEEKRLYHRKDGKIVKEFDDILCAVRYALMNLRFAAPLKGYQMTRRDPNRTWMTA